MSRLKAVFAVLISLALIAGFALLPKGIAIVSDFLSNGKPGTASMDTVELTVYSDQTDEPGYMMRKLALYQNMTTIPISPDQAKMTEEEVLTAAIEGMTLYMEANMFEWFEYHYSGVEPYIGIDPADKSKNIIFWAVTFTVKKAPYHQLFLHIDDETGKILYMEYETDGPDQFNYYYPDNQRLMMEGFVDSFFGPLNLASHQLSEYKNLVSQNVMERKLTDDVTCVRYTFEDSEYGTIHVEFQITPKGFLVSYPSE